MPHTFTADKQTSQSFFNELEKYMHSNVLTEENKFICKHEADCRKSCTYERRELHPGQLHHVGPLYDLKRNGKPFRVVVSGAEYGDVNIGEPNGSLRKRTDVIQCLDPKNPHMNGTLCLLQMLFGKDPDNGDLKIEVNGKPKSIFKAFSLANFLLCSAVPEKAGRSNNAFTPATRYHCAEHYEKMLEILKPQIVVLQGARSWDYFHYSHGISLDHGAAKIEQVEVGGKPILILPLYHPSYQRKAWGGANRPATKNYIKPAVKKLLAKYDKLY